MKLWLDDVLDPPDGTWIVFRTAPEAIAWLEGGGLKDLVAVSLDHHLGACQACLEDGSLTCPHAGDGYMVAAAIERLVIHDRARCREDLTITVHSQDLSGGWRTRAAIDSVESYLRYG